MSTPATHSIADTRTDIRIDSRNRPAKPTESPATECGIGVVAPFDFALDRELWRWTPPDISLYLTRTPYVPEPVTVRLATEVSAREPVAQATRDVLTPGPATVAYACTSGSFVDGVRGEQRLRDVMTSAGAPSAVTTSGALVDAIRYLGLSRLAIVTPYVDALTTRLRTFLFAHGIATTAAAGMGLTGNIWRVPADETVRLAREVDSPDAEAVFFSCTNLPTYDVIAPLEQELGKPVLSANQVTMWAALRALGRQPGDAPHRLFQRHPPLRHRSMAPTGPSTVERSTINHSTDGGSIDGVAGMAEAAQPRLRGWPGVETHRGRDRELEQQHVSQGRRERRVG